MHRLLLFSVFLLVSLFGMAKGATGWLNLTDTSSQSHSMTVSPASMNLERKGDDTILRRDGSGRFFLSAQANGRDTRFLVDTGADIVALSTDEAEQLDVKFDRADFQPITRTASGTGMGQRVTIERLTVDDHEFRNVDAVVVDGLDTNLLGQSIIRQLGSVELGQDTMVIHHSA